MESCKACKVAQCDGFRYAFVMNVYAGFALCFIPLVVLFISFCLLVPQYKTLHGLFACLLGLLCVAPIAVLQFVVESVPFFNATSLALLFLRAVVINGLIEETIKMLIMFLLPKKTVALPAFFANALLCGFALGCFESAIYVISGYHHIELRLFTAVVVHASCAALSGLFVFSLHAKRSKILPFVYAVFFHGVYNYFAGFSTNIKWFSLVVIALSLLECRIQYRAFFEQSELLPKLPDTDGMQATDSHA